MTRLERAPTILAEKGHPPRDPYPLDASEQELLFSELTARIVVAQVRSRKVVEGFGGC